MWKFLTICLVLVTSRAVLSIDLTQNNKYGGQSILNTTCNKDTQIDFLFTANSKFVCSSLKCSNENPSASSLKFMDINGNNLDLKLVEVLIVPNSVLSINGLPVTPTKFISLRFTNTGSTQTVAIILPIVSTASLNGAIVTGNYVTGGKLAEFLTTNSLDLTAFSYLN